MQNYHNWQNWITVSLTGISTLPEPAITWKRWHMGQNNIITMILVIFSLKMKLMNHICQSNPSFLFWPNCSISVGSLLKKKILLVLRIILSFSCGFSGHTATQFTFCTWNTLILFEWEGGTVCSERCIWLATKSIF